jgi:hypothetical protein
VAVLGWLKRLFAGGRDDGGADFRRLLNLARGDRERAERMIAAELRRSPELGRAQAIRRAADRLEYERSR